MVPYQDCIPRIRALKSLYYLFIFGHFPGDKDIVLRVGVGVGVGLLVVAAICCCYCYQKRKQTGM